MEHLTDKVQIDYVWGNSTGATAAAYGFPHLDMQDFDEVTFVINCPNLTIATATGAGNECIVNAAVYTATAATSTAMTAVSSATASFGSTAAAQVNGAKALFITFNTASSGTTFSINGKGIKCDGTAAYASAEILCATGVSNATAATSLAAYINSTNSTFSSYLVATTDLPVGATMVSSNTLYIAPKNVGAISLSATGFYGATANKGVLVAGQYEAAISVPAEKLGGARYVNISVQSSGIATPFYVHAIRSKARYMPPVNGGLAANVKLGSTTT